MEWLGQEPVDHTSDLIFTVSLTVGSVLVGVVVAAIIKYQMGKNRKDDDKPGDDDA